MCFCSLSLADIPRASELRSQTALFGKELPRSQHGSRAPSVAPTTSDSQIDQLADDDEATTAAGAGPSLSDAGELAVVQAPFTQHNPAPPNDICLAAQAPAAQDDPSPSNAGLVSPQAAVADDASSLDLRIRTESHAPGAAALSTSSSGAVPGTPAHRSTHRRSNSHQPAIPSPLRETFSLEPEPERTATHEPEPLSKKTTIESITIATPSPSQAAADYAVPMPDLQEGTDAGVSAQSSEAAKDGMQVDVSKPKQTHAASFLEKVIANSHRSSSASPAPDIASASAVAPAVSPTVSTAVIDTYLSLVPPFGADKESWPKWLQDSVIWIQNKPFAEEFGMILEYFVRLEAHHGFLEETPPLKVCDIIFLNSSSINELF